MGRRYVVTVVPPMTLPPYEEHDYPSLGRAQAAAHRFVSDPDVQRAVITLVVSTHLETVR